uniref:HTH araC/xylS-type domain-containing protein n=1 Tax=Macrostomum lignano TaxID=282301 RepID=A0A1I8FR77_9PLAT
MMSSRSAGKQLLDSTAIILDEFYWSMHRAASPALLLRPTERFYCFNTFGDQSADQPQLQPSCPSISTLKNSFRALRKLRRDLAELTSLRLAADFGYAPRVVAFLRYAPLHCATVAGRRRASWREIDRLPAHLPGSVRGRRA